MISSEKFFDFSNLDSLAVDNIRILSADMVQKANSGHPGMPMGFALPAHILWTRFLSFNPDQPFWPGRDRFILSAGHGSVLLYSLLHLAGYDLSIEDLKNFRQWESRTPGHPEYGVVPGVETTTGPLGQGFGNGVGMAVAQRYIREKLGLEDSSEFDPLDNRIYVVAGDGCLQEGISSEAASFAGHQKLGRLIVLYDDNRISIDGSTDISWSENVCDRFNAYGWHTQQVEGDDPAAILNSIRNAQDNLDEPSLIAIHTHIGFGSPNKQDSEKAHGAPLGEDELKATREQLGWTLPAFEIPDEVYNLYAEIADERREIYREWKRSFEIWMKENPERESLWKILVEGEEPGNWDSNIPVYEAGQKVATRAASGEALNAFAINNPQIIGGCADLTGSVKTDIKNEDLFLPGIKNGRNIRFGIREHGMGAIANGMALYGGLRPYTGTFLVFSDYMRPPIRLASMMDQPVIFVFSHDSIGVGEDGPTHQPIEHLAALRSIPGLWVIRPGDANEMVEAWRIALDRNDGPTTIISTRQGLPVIDRNKHSATSNSRNGGYILADCQDGTPETILLATGSELTLSLAVWEKLVEKGIKARLVSLPCWELFDLQDDVYQEQVLPRDVNNRIALEAGISMGWERFTGDNGKIISIEKFGASAPGGLLFEKYGYTVDVILSKIL